MPPLFHQGSSARQGMMGQTQQVFAAAQVPSPVRSIATKHYICSRCLLICLVTASLALGCLVVPLCPHTVFARSSIAHCSRVQSCEQQSDDRKLRLQLFLLSCHMASVPCVDNSTLCGPAANARDLQYLAWRAGLASCHHDKTKPCLYTWTAGHKTRKAERC